MIRLNALGDLTGVSQGFRSLQASSVHKHLPSCVTWTAIVGKAGREKSLTRLTPMRGPHSAVNADPILTHHSSFLCEQKGDQDRAPGRDQSSIKSNGEGLSLHCWEGRALPPIIPSPSSPLLCTSTVQSLPVPVLGEKSFSSSVWLLLLSSFSFLSSSPALLFHPTFKLKCVPMLFARHSDLSGCSPHLLRDLLCSLDF